MDRQPTVLSKLQHVAQNQPTMPTSSPLTGEHLCVTPVTDRPGSAVQNQAHSSRRQQVVWSRHVQMIDHNSEVRKQLPNYFFRP